MIQRIQSVYLALAIVLNLSVVFTPIFNRGLEDPQLWIGAGFIGLAVLSVLLTAVVLGLFKNRQKQISLIKPAMLLQVGSCAFGLGILFSMGGIGRYLWDEALGCLLLLAALAAQFLAMRAIRKDEELVRSIDRIR